eukprot:703135-Pyramimonas_sp.AAC.1
MRDCNMFCRVLVVARHPALPPAQRHHPVLAGDPRASDGRQLAAVVAAAAPPDGGQHGARVVVVVLLVAVKRSTEREDA